MTNEQIEAERKVFEAWIMDSSSARLDRDPAYGDYVYSGIHEMWSGWLARAELALAAKPAVETAPCPKCGGAMKPGKHIVPFTGGEPEMPGGEVVTVSVRPGPAKLADCMKCADCGHSETMEVRNG